MEWVGLGPWENYPDRHSSALLGRWASSIDDLATPYLATKHDMEHLDIPQEARQRIRLELYEAGHMMYLHEPSLRKFRDDLARFIRDTDRI